MISLTWARKGQRRYAYRPGLMDACDPNVIEGRPIAPDSVVVIYKRVGRALAWIEDCEGNKQSVWRAALVPLRAQEYRVRGWNLPARNSL